MLVCAVVATGVNAAALSMMMANGEGLKLGRMKSLHMVSMFVGTAPGRIC